MHAFRPTAITVLCDAWGFAVDSTGRERRHLRETESENEEMTPTLTDEQLSVIERVKKLLALASNNPNENEASAASAKAMDLLAAWNLDMHIVAKAEKKGTSNRADEKTFGGFYKWQTAIWTAVSELNFCMYWRLKGEGRDKRDSFSYSHRVLGRQENVIATQVMAEYLQQTVERLAQDKVRAEGRGPLSREMIAFREGMADRLVERLNDLRRERLAADKAKQAAEQAAYGAANPTVSTALVLQDVINTESDLNNDHLMGWEPGTTARRRAEDAARMAKWRAEWAAEAEAKRLWAIAHPEEAAAQRAKEQAELSAYTKKEEARSRARDRARERNGYTYRSRARSAADKRRDTVEYGEGRSKANDIGLDQQIREGRSNAALGE